MDAEIVVIGGGSSGCAVAGRLAEAGRDVLLVEAGPDYGPLGDERWPVELVDARMIPPSHDWGYHSGERYPERAERLSFERAKVIGGCSSHNGCIAAVGHPSDYDGWTMPGWSGAELRPLFATALERMRVRVYDEGEVGPYHRACLDAAAALGWPRADDLADLDGGVGFGLEAVNVWNSVRFNAAFAYVDPVRGRLRISDHTEVDRLVDGPDGVTVHASRLGEPLVLRAGTVVLSAGSYGTPAILQRSGVGHPDLLRAVGIGAAVELPGVGENLHDHPTVEVAYAVTDGLQRYLDEATAGGFLPEEQTLGKFASPLAVDGLYDLHLFPVCAATQTSKLHGLVLMVVSCVNPRSRGRILVSGPDHRLAPEIDHGYFTDAEGHDLAVIAAGVELARDLAATEPVASMLGPVVADFADDTAVLRGHAHYYHPVGTCRMGTDALSVCDERGRVRGLTNVVVADASLMPTIPRANTNIPAVVIGERIARFLTAS